MRGLAQPDSNVSCAPILAHYTQMSEYERSVQDANKVGAQDSRYPAMSALCAQHSLQDIKLASCEEQGPPN
jgi:hypothetical protein